MSHNLLLKRAGAWFLDSGIQEPTGGVARYYCADIRENKLISTEITGYALSTLVYLHTVTGGKDYLDAAKRAGLFLTRVAWNAKLRIFPFEYNPVTPITEPLGYFFDSGIIVRGLLQLAKVTGTAEFREIALQAACGMAEHFKESEGGYVPILRLPSADPLPFGKTWSRLPGCYQLKSALAWDEAGDPTLRDRFESALRTALACHHDFLPGAQGDRIMDRLHAYCYFLEALLSRAERSECAEALRCGIGRVSGYLREIGPVFARSDVYAQLLRVRLWAEQRGVGLVDRLSAEEEANKLARFQISSLDSRVNGGFYFGSRNGQFIPHVNPVSTGFALQALAMWEQYRQGSPLTPTDAMI